MYELYIANKNYSSWSLRPWVLLRELQIPFAEHLIPFGDASRWDAYRKISPSGKVPCLIDGDTVVWDSLAIAEYLADRFPGVWPADRGARAWARCAAAEMHSGFNELRTRCSMTCGVRIRLKEFPPALEQDIARLSALWSDGLHRFGGPFLAGEAFSAVDAFFAPVAFRVRSYGLTLGPAAAEYCARLLNLSSMRDWYGAALEETFRDQPHEDEMLDAGTVLEDLRKR
ncbi:MAG: glutathione S-transferase family protein [Pseudomonadota bacterium]|nr:glutathione S-transferase family protein [Pseudomonadota bacterium]